MNKLLAFICIILIIISCYATYSWIDIVVTYKYSEAGYYYLQRNNNFLRKIIRIEWKGKRKDYILKTIVLSINSMNKGDKIDIKDKDFGSYILKIDPKSEDIFVDNMQFKFKSGRFIDLTDAPE